MYSSWKLALDLFKVTYSLFFGFSKGRSWISYRLEKSEYCLYLNQRVPNTNITVATIYQIFQLKVQECPNPTNGRFRPDNTERYKSQHWFIPQVLFCCRHIQCFLYQLDRLFLWNYEHHTLGMRVLLWTNNRMNCLRMKIKTLLITKINQILLFSLALTIMMLIILVILSQCTSAIQI